jgi:hypothetical protein
MSCIFDSNKDPPPEKLGESRRLGGLLEIQDREFPDPRNRERIWVVTGAFWKTPTSQIPGLRIEVRDQKGFISMVNQRDAEVLLGLARPGDISSWLGERYIAPQMPGWVGLGVDAEGFRDLLYDVEAAERYSALRRTGSASLRVGMVATLRVHTGSQDVLCSYELTENILSSEQLFFQDVDKRWRRQPTPHTRVLPWVSV